MRILLLALVGLAVVAGAATSAPVPKGLKKKPPLAAVMLPTGEMAFDVTFDDTPFLNVVEALERATGLIFLSKDVPNVNVTLKADGVSLAELFAQLDEQISPHGWRMQLRRQSFATLVPTAKIPR